MKILSATTCLLGLTAAAPSVLENRSGNKPNSVRIKGISLMGTGCPTNSADVQVDATGSIFECTFSKYIIQTGEGTMAGDWRKNCKLTVNMEFDQGFQFSVVDTDMMGYAEIPNGLRGECTNQFHFSQNPRDKVATDITLKSGHDGPFDLYGKAGLLSWSTCGGSTAILNLNTQCAIKSATSPNNEVLKHKSALIAVDNISGTLKVKFAVQWRWCGGPRRN